MTKKIIIAVTAALLIGAISLLAAQKAQKKEAAEELKKQVKAVEENPATAVEPTKHRQRLLDELKAACQANDREKMGQIIQKMEQRREKMQKLAKLERWHKWSHHRMEMRGYGRHPEAKRSKALLQGGAPEGGPGWGEAKRRTLRTESPFVGRCPGCGQDAFGPPPREHRQMKPWRQDPGNQCPPGVPGPKRCPMKNLPPGDNPAPEQDW